MIGTGSPGGIEQMAVRLSGLLGVDWLAMAAHYSRTHRNVSPGRRLRSRPCGEREAVHRGEIGLDINERSAVDAIDVAHHECESLDIDELDRG